MSQFLLSIDQGTTSCRTVLFNSQFKSVDIEQKEFTQYFPEPGWVEHDAEEIWATQCETMRKIVRRNSLGAHNVTAIGITNQRETWVAWNKATGKPLCRALVWQDRRTTNRCEALRRRGLESRIRAKTGLLLDPYFSGTKAEWLLKHNPAVREAARRGTLAFGTMDSYLAARLTGNRKHVTEPGNASRTLLFNLKTQQWDDDLLRIFGVPKSSLPEVLPSDSEFGLTDLPFLRGVKIHGIAGDQQASLFGQRCFRAGDVKNTYGTGCFLLRNIGGKYVPPSKGILGTVAWNLSGKVTYAHEGAVLIGGAVIQFLRDQWGVVTHAAETETLAAELKGNDGVYFVPAFAGLGTPYWDPNARGAILGLTRGTSKAHLCRAALESIAYQTAEVCHAFGGAPSILRADGGATQNRFLMQFQADILGTEIQVSDNPEVTALGAAMLAALGAGVTTLQKLKAMRLPSHKYRPRMGNKGREELLSQWKKAVTRCRRWAP